MMAKKQKRPQTEIDAPKAKRQWSVINYGPNRAQRRHAMYRRPDEGTVHKLRQPRKTIPRLFRVPTINRPFRRQDRS